MAGLLHDAPLTLETVALSELVLDPHNARLHGQDNLASITGSLQVFGQREPIIVRRADNTIIGGNGRVEAMRRLGWSTCSVAYIDCTDAEATALGLALNRTAETASWDTDQLESLLSEVKEAGFSTDSFGFSQEQVDKLLADTLDAQGEPEQNIEDLVEKVPDADIDVTDVEPPAEPKTKLGDIWVCGDHRVICGDSACFGTVEKLMDGDKADMVFTDPPYNLAGEKNTSAAVIRDSYKRLADSKWDSGFVFEDVQANLLAFLQDDATVYVCTSHHLAGSIWAWMKQWSVYNCFCVWRKSNPMPSLHKRHWTWCTELICYATRGKHTFNFPTEGHALSVWDIPKSTSNDLHPTMKPVALPQWAIAHSSHCGDIVLDLFGGAGSTLLACQQTGRRARLCELDPRYVDVIVSRYEKLTGDTAVLLGQTNAEAEAP